MKNTGIALLPLHHGHPPKWLFNRMIKLSRAILKAIAQNYDEKEILQRLSNSFWFQSLGNVLGFDWHSSGLTTTTLAALSIALENTDLSIRVIGGKGKSHKIKTELYEKLKFLGIEKRFEGLLKISRIAARTDNYLVMDGYNLYIHSLIIDSRGRWCIIQQGMNKEKRLARRYHWIHSYSNLNNPHSSLKIDNIENNVLNLATSESEKNREKELTIINEFSEFKKLFSLTKSNQSTLNDFIEKEDLPKLIMPKRHELRRIHLSKKAIERLREIEGNIKSYEELLLMKGLGKNTYRALALVAEIVFDAPLSRKDPALYSFAHGGKDGYPFPVNKKIYDKSIEILELAIRNAELNDKLKRIALQRVQNIKSSE